MTKLFNLDFISVAAKNPTLVIKAKNSVRMFYLLQVVFAFINLMKIGAVDPERSGFLPIWPMSWAASIPYSLTAQIVAVAFVLASLLACFFWHKRLVKILVFLTFWQVHALDSSFGYINHFYYLPLYALFFFMFLPDTNEDGAEDYETSRKLMLVYWGAIAAIFATYTLSGFWKIYWGIHALLVGRISSFSIMAFPEHVARKTIFESREFFFSAFVINNPILAWISYLGTIYVEFVAFFVAFKPRLHKIWAFIFIFMHVGILLVIGIPFFESVFVLCIILLNSPFTQKFSLLDLAFDLPLIGPIASWVFKRR